MMDVVIRIGDQRHMIASRSEQVVLDVWEVWEKSNGGSRF